MKFDKKLEHKFNREDLLLYAITDRTWLNGKALCEQVCQVLEGGATFLQLREKELEEKDFLQEAFILKQLCKNYHVPFVINDNIQIAKEVDADGVHIGQKDMQLTEARRILGPDKIIGVSAQTLEQALLAEKMGADYLGVGAVFTTGTKKDACHVSLDELKAICEAVKIPVVAIGGIQYENVSELANTKISGIAVISALFASNDIKNATSRLQKKAVELFGKGEEK